MANSWFRLYSEFATDPKVQMLSEAMQRRLIMLFCFRCNGDATLHDDEIVFQLRISHDEWEATKAEFIRRGFIDIDNNLLNWDKRQFRSDSSTERSRKHREQKQQSCNVAATPPDTEQIQNRTDTEKKDSRGASKVSADPPPKVNFQELISVWNDVLGNHCPRIQRLTEQRKRLLANRLKDSFGNNLEEWRKYCEAIKLSSFCVGDNDRGWRANLDWALTPKAISKVLEGAYSNKNIAPESEPIEPPSIEKLREYADRGIKLTPAQMQMLQESKTA